MVLGRRLDAPRQYDFRAKPAHKLDAQQRMQLHAILRNADLAVKNVKEADALYAYKPCRRETAKVRFRGRELCRQRLTDGGEFLCLQRTAGALAFAGRDLGDHGAAKVIGV